MIQSVSKQLLTYYKCLDCLAAFTAKDQPKECLCGGKLECMGTVRGTRYSKTEQAPPCDGRCTNAQGPTCDCSCQGECHGTGRLVETVVSEGIVKIRSMGNKYLEQGKQYRDLLVQANTAYNARYAEVNKNIASGVWVNREQYFEARDRRVWLNRIKAGKQFKARQSELQGYIDKLNKGE